MELKTAILSVITIFILTYIISRSVHIKNFSALALASLISLILLFFMYPPNKIDFLSNENKTWNRIYVILIIIFILIIGSYVIVKATSDRNPPPESPGEEVAGTANPEIEKIVIS